MTPQPRLLCLHQSRGEDVQSWPVAPWHRYWTFWDSSECCFQLGKPWAMSSHFRLLELLPHILHVRVSRLTQVQNMHYVLHGRLDQAMWKATPR